MPEGINARRKTIDGLFLDQVGNHAGLALQRLLAVQGDTEAKSRKELLKSIEKTQVGETYKLAFERWKEALKHQDAVFIEATTLTPLAIGLGNASPIENGLSTHHTYGTPYLPGSVIKGLMVRAARHYGLDEKQQEILFGTTQNAAHLVYWDGWLDPSSKQPFQKDVITVHHQSYYQGGNQWPTDFDDPNPVSFLSVKPGTKFCLALSSSSENASDWVYRAAEILKWSLENLGLGGKTNAGYGYFEVRLPPKPKTQADLAEEVYANFKAQIEGIKPRDPLRDVRELVSKLRSHPVELRGKVVEATLRKLEDLGASQSDKAKARALLEEL